MSLYVFIQKIGKEKENSGKRKEKDKVPVNFWVTKREKKRKKGKRKNIQFQE